MASELRRERYMCCQSRLTIKRTGKTPGSKMVPSKRHVSRKTVSCVSMGLMAHLYE